MHAHQWWMPRAATAIVLLGFAACAHSPGSSRTLVPPSKDASVDRYTQLAVEVKNNTGSALLDNDRQRITEMIVSKLKEKAPNRFATINMPTPDQPTLHAIVTVTRYEEGNSFARLMLAGLGQIHIDGEVVMEDQATKTPLAKHEVTKTFAWGGFYGGTTRITDVEKGFVEGVVAVLLGQAEDQVNASETPAQGNQQTAPK